MDNVFLLAGIQTVIIIVLTGDRWVHRVTGRKSLEARVTDLEGTNEKSSVALGKIQTGIVEIQVLQARQDEHLTSTDRRVEDLRNRLERR